jgi:hypothetical protein
VPARRYRRRFEIAVQDHGQRPQRATRPIVGRGRVLLEYQIELLAQGVDIGVRLEPIHERHLGRKLSIEVALQQPVLAVAESGTTRTVAACTAVAARAGR